MLGVWRIPSRLAEELRLEIRCALPSSGARREIVCVQEGLTPQYKSFAQVLSIKDPVDCGNSNVDVPTEFVKAQHSSLHDGVELAVLTMLGHKFLDAMLP